MTQIPLLDENGVPLQDEAGANLLAEAGAEALVIGTGALNLTGFAPDVTISTRIREGGGGYNYPSRKIPKWARTRNKKRKTGNNKKVTIALALLVD